MGHENYGFTLVMESPQNRVVEQRFTNMSINWRWAWGAELGKKAKSNYRQIMGRPWSRYRNRSREHERHWSTKRKKILKMKAFHWKIETYPLLLTTTEIHTLFAYLRRTVRNETIENLKVWRRTSVRSPSGSNSKSPKSEACSITLQYFSSLNSCPNKMFSRWYLSDMNRIVDYKIANTSVAFWIQAVCEQYATRPPKVTEPVTFLISPMSAMRRLDFQTRHDPRLRPTCHAVWTW